MAADSLAAFFLFGVAMCALTIVTLAFPGSVLEPVWRLNPDAHRSFRSIGPWAFVLMATVGAACLFSAIGLFRRAPWGRVLAVLVLVTNLAGDVAASLLRHDARTLIGLPIGGAMIALLLSRPVKRLFISNAR